VGQQEAASGLFFVEVMPGKKRGEKFIPTSSIWWIVG
jgi:hypothetical protein